MDIIASITALVEWTKANPLTIAITGFNAAIGIYSWYRTKKFVNEVVIKAEQRKLLKNLHHALFALERYYLDHSTRMGLNIGNGIARRYIVRRDRATVLIKRLSALFPGSEVFQFEHNWKRWVEDEVPAAPGAPFTRIGSPMRGIEKAKELSQRLVFSCR